MTRLLAEYKRYSPWHGPITDRTLPDVVSEYDTDPDVFGVSIVVDSLWGGSLEDVQRARSLTDKPILAKFGLSAQRNDYGRAAILAGADWYLTHDWVRAADDPARAWLELHHPADIPPELPLVVVCNNRNIDTGTLNPDAALEVAAKLPRRGSLICAASGYEAAWDIPENFDFGLIGTALLSKQTDRKPLA